MLKIPKSARIGWNSFDDKTVQRDDQESIFLATFDDPLTDELYKFQIDYSYYNRGRYGAAPRFILHVYACGKESGDYADTTNYADIYYDTMDEAEGDINYWLAFFAESVLPKDLILSQKIIYTPLDFKINNARKKIENFDYQAFTFSLNDLKIIYRAAKITPIKIGQFVTLWKRETGKEIEPLQSADDFDFVIISTRKENQFGQFIFPKSVLIEKRIISTDTHEGKRAFRVYPPWDLTQNKQAKTTQKWQLDYFLNVLGNEKVDLEQAKKLTKIKTISI